MESVDRSVRQAFALDRFASAFDKPGLYRQYLTQRTFRVSLDDVYRFANALIIERRAFFDLGKAIGFFRPDAELEFPAIDPFVIEDYSHGTERWPSWFISYAKASELPDLGLSIASAISEEDSPSTFSLFQSALLLSEAFNQPLTFYLQRALQDDHSPLDQPALSISSEQFWAEWQDKGTGRVVNQTVDNLARCVAGLVELAELLSAFDHLFLAYRHPEMRHVSKGKHQLVRTISNLLTWRLNLHDQRTIVRLNTVSEIFWQLCRKEFAAYSQLNILFAEAPSRQALGTLLDNWKSRSDPDADPSSKITRNDEAVSDAG